MVIVWLFLIVLAILWLCMPFAIFGTKDLLRALIREQQNPNHLLQEQADRAKAIREKAEVLIHR
ncbi:MAG: hypothetical protein WA159_20800 [Variovorax sp.]